MVAVNLEWLVINDAADPALGVAVKMLAGSSKSWPSGASDRLYAGGRTRLAGGPRPGRVWTPLLGQMPLSVAQWLHGRSGRLHWARDPLGGKVACWWDDVPYAEQGPTLPGGVHAATATLTLREITHAEVPS